MYEIELAYLMTMQLWKLLRVFFSVYSFIYFILWRFGAKMLGPCDSLRYITGNHFESEDTDVDLTISRAGNDGIPCDCILKNVLNGWTICSVVDWEVNLPNGWSLLGSSFCTGDSLQSFLCKWSYIYFILKGLDVVSDVFIQIARSSVASQQTELFCDRKWSESRRIRSPAGSVQPISFQTRCDGAVTGPSELRSEVLICLCKCSPWWFISSNPAVPGRRCRFSSLATPPAST